MLLVGSGTGLGSVAASVEGSALEAIGAQRSTLLWRVEGWRVLLSDERLTEPLDFLIGLPFGSGYLRTVFGSQIGVSPHNFYISIFLRMGVLGLLAFILLYIGCLRPLLAAARKEHAATAPAQLLFVLLVTQLLFFVPYGPSYEQGMLLGAGLGMVLWLPETTKDLRRLRDTSCVRVPLPQS
jgi:hypothetical protein